MKINLTTTVTRLRILVAIVKQQKDDEHEMQFAMATQTTLPELSERGLFVS